ncbi:hypothetical protein ACF0H5_005269 [Mactra antiquata]
MPTNIETEEVYVHDGKLSDEKYRLPWKRGKGESYQVLIEESMTIYDGGNKFMPTKPVCTIEPFDSQNGSSYENVTDEVNFALELDIVQSSNPSSQDIFTPNEFFDTYDEFDEIFEKERISWHTSDEYRIDLVGPVDNTLHDALQMKPSLSMLKSELVTVQVKDPLLLHDGQIASESAMFNSKLPEITCNIPVLQQTFDTNVFYEKFVTIAEENACTKGSIEEVVTEGCDLPMVEHPLLEITSILQSVTGAITHIQMEDEVDIKKIVSKYIVKQSYEDLKKLEVFTVDLPPLHQSTFLDFNEIIITEQDRLCEKAVLDVPEIQSSSWVDPNYEKQLIPKLEEANIETSEIRFLDRDAMQRLMEAVWQNEKFCNEILACRLPETKSITPCLKRTDPLEVARQELGVLKSCSTGKSDLALSWEIVKSSHNVIDPCKELEQYFTDNDTCDAPQEKVETFEKFSTVDVFGRELYTISTVENKIDMPPPKENTSTCKLERKTKPVFTSCDPLEAFMALRSKADFSIKADDMKAMVLQNSNISENENDKPELLEDTVKALSENDVITTTYKKQDKTHRLTSSKQTKVKTKHHTVQIKLSEELHQILDVLHSSSENCMMKLKQCGELPSTATFLSLSTDVSRFILKQREKYLHDNHYDAFNDPTFKLILILHGLVGAAGLAVNCCLESAIGYINALQDKYKDILGSTMDPFREKLFQMRTYFHQKNLLHPKIVSLCKEVETWLRQKRAKSKDCEQKILVLIKHDIPSLMNCLTHALCLGNMLFPVVLTSKEPESIIECLDQHNCLIAPCRLMSDSFPWAQFNLVMEYEYEENSEWQQICLRQHIRHIGLFMDREISLGTKVIPEETKTQHSDKQIIVIGSTKITESTDLLHLLEAGQNIVLVERDYSCIKGWNHLYYSDIDVDVNTGIVLQTLEDIQDDSTIQYLVIKMAALTLKYTNCWLILSSSAQSKSYTFQSHVISNIAKLQSDIANVVHHSSYASIKALETHVKSTTKLHLRGASLIGNYDKPDVEYIPTKQNTKFPMHSNGKVKNNAYKSAEEHTSHYFKSCDPTLAFLSNAENSFTEVTKQQNPVRMAKPFEESYRYPPLNKQSGLENPTQYYGKDVETSYPSMVMRSDRQMQAKPQPRLFQNEIFPQPTETFEYNHGLPFTVHNTEREKRTPNNVFEQADTLLKRTPGSADDYINYTAKINDNLSEFSSGSINSLSDFEKEFPSVENLYKSLYEDTKKPTSIYCPELEMSGVHDTFRNYTGIDSSFPCHPLLEQSYSKKEFEKPMQVQQTMLNETSRDMKDNDVSVTIQEQGLTWTDRQNENIDQGLNLNFSNEKFDFHPKLIESDVRAPDMNDKNQSHDTRPNFIVNPLVKRLSRKQTMDLPVEKKVDDTLFSVHTSFANELRETTKKALENSQQFSGFELNTRRHPRHNVRVGLAQPLVRAIQDEKPLSGNIYDEERQLMNKSLWSVENSPPMDLDYENPGTNNLLSTQQPQYGRSNKAVFTNQTPNKKRKLTYQPVAGRKGQTKLVFK